MPGDEIVRRLMSRDKKDKDELKNSMPTEGASEEAEDTTDTDDYEEETPAENESEDSEEKTSDSLPSSGGSSPRSSRSSAPMSPEEGEEQEEENPIVEKEPEEGNTNPLDNQYAISYQIGDSVVLSYTKGRTSELKGTVEGYDKEGFYRIKWSDGSITNGLTDIALSDIVVSQRESMCICGNTHFVKEENHIICDECGRSLREATNMPIGSKFQNAGDDWELLATKGDYSLVYDPSRKYDPYVVAWKLDDETKSWGQGHYFNDQFSAMRYLKKQEGKLVTIKGLGESKKKKSAIYTVQHDITTAKKPDITSAIKEALCHKNT